MENRRILYDFCPRCSGLMKNGVCIACGYEKKQTADAAQQEPNKTDGPAALQRDAVGNDAQDSEVTRPGSRNIPGNVPGGQNLSALQMPERKKHTGFIIGICIGGLLFLLVLCIAIYLIVSDVKSHSPGAWNPLQSSDGNDAMIIDGEEEGYVPDASDEYYVEITDSLRGDLPYQVEWQEYEVENEDTATSYYALFPVLTGDVSNLEEMNRAIEAAAREEEVFCQYAAEDEDIDSCSIYKEGYVTYMDEDVISVVFLEYIYINDAALPRISDINIDVRNGSVLEHGNMVDYSVELAQRVRKQNAYQNSVDIESMEWSDEDIMTLLQSEDGVAFYTPVGLEVGFNYSSSDTGYGWLTVTLKA